MRLYRCNIFEGGKRGIRSVTKEVTSNMKIRAVAIIVFRKWFGDMPEEHWHKDGFMAEARNDHRKRVVQLEQINRDMSPIALLPAHTESLI